MIQFDEADIGRDAETYWAETAGPAPADDGPPSGDTRADVAIIGGGYTGLWAAKRLAGHHGRSVRLFEARSIGSGASGRNGGFTCLGGVGITHAAIVKRVGPVEARRFFAMQNESIIRIRDFLGSEDTAGDAVGHGEILLAHRPSRIAELEAEQAMLAKHGDIQSVLFGRAELARRGLAGPQFHAALHIPQGFGVHPLKLTHKLLLAARGAGAQVHSRSPVLAISPGGNGWIVRTGGSTCHARQVIIATNGYSQDELIPAAAGRMLPVVSAILVTRPLTNAEREAQGWTTADMAYDSRHLLHYFRLLPDGRFLFGGRGGLDASAATEQRSKAWLARSFRRLFPAWRDVDITHFWRGLACVTTDRTVHAGALDGAQTLWLGGGYHGNGVAMSAIVGPLLADLCAGTAQPDTHIPALMRGPPPRFHLPGGHRAWMRAAYTWYRIRDAMP